MVDQNYDLKLVDFGSASYIPADTSKFFTRYNGTPHFASPEIVDGYAYRGPEAEVWTMGVLLYTIVFGENPFQDKYDIKNFTGSFMYPREIDRGNILWLRVDLQSLIEGCLCIKVSRRMTLHHVGPLKLTCRFVDILGLVLNWKSWKRRGQNSLNLRNKAVVAAFHFWSSRS